MARHSIDNVTSNPMRFPYTLVFPESLEYNESTGQYYLEEGCAVTYLNAELDMVFHMCSGNTLPSHRWEDLTWDEMVRQYHAGMPVA